MVSAQGRRDEIGAMEVFKDNLLHAREETAEARLAAEERRRLAVRAMARSFEAEVGSNVPLRRQLD